MIIVVKNYYDFGELRIGGYDVFFKRFTCLSIENYRIHYENLII